MEMVNTLAYYDTATITAVKSFIIQAPVVTHSLNNLNFHAGLLQSSKIGFYGIFTPSI